MADTKISGATANPGPAGTDEFATNVGGASRRTTLAQVKTFVNTAPAFAAGSASAGTWPTLASGTLLTTAEAGALELDANCLYGTTDAGNRGVVAINHFIRADSSRSLPNDTNENAIFNSPTNGRITLETGLYKFEALIAVTGMSATSGNALIDWLGAGTATVGTWLWMYYGKDGTNATVAALNGAVRITQDSAASIQTAGTSTQMCTFAQGTFEVTSAGTMIPSIDLVTANAATLAAGSYFMVQRIGSTTAVSVGQWD